MAMFDLKNSEDIKLTGCHTDSSTLVKGENLPRLEATDCSAFAQHRADPVTPKRSLRQFFAENLFTACLGFIFSLIAAYLVFRLGWTG